MITSLGLVVGPVPLNKRWGCFSRLRLADDGYSCVLRWTLTTTDGPPSDSKRGHLRYRLNLLINERLRLSYGQ